MLTKTVDVAGCKATFHTETGLDVIRFRIFLQKVVGTDDLQNELWLQFGAILAQTTDVSMPFAWPEITSNMGTLLEARDAFFALPSTVYMTFRDALAEVNKPPMEEELYPTDEKKA